MLLNEIDSRFAPGQPAILKTAAEDFLMAAKYTRQDARTIVASDSFEAVSGMGKGHPVELHRREKDGTAAEMPVLLDLNKNADFAEVDFRRPHLEHTAEIGPSQARMNTGDLQLHISAADSSITSTAEPGQVSGKAQGKLFEAPFDDRPDGANRETEVRI